MKIMKKDKKFDKIKWVIIFLFILYLLIFWISKIFITTGPAEGNLLESLGEFERALSIIQTSYVEKPEPEKLIDGAIEGMLRSLDDPYSRLLKKEDYTDLKIETKGEFGGVGFVITIRENKLTVVAPIAGTPASKAGIMAGDWIIKINNEPTEGMTLTEAVSKIRGKPGTKVTLWIKREEHPEPLKFEITRDIIKVKSVFSKIVNYKNKRIGYIKLARFSEDTADKLREILKKFEIENLDGLILDLRNNPGGLLYSGWQVADLFIKDGIIVSTKGRNKQNNREFYASPTAYCTNLPMVVVINKGTASASEIVTGALKDHKRAIIVGETSFGKGVVQTVFELNKNKAITLTTARYYTPSGICIHKKGIKPDITVSLPKLSSGEIKEFQRLYENKKFKHIINSFVKKHTDFIEIDKKTQKKLLNELQNELKSKNIKADNKTLRRFVKFYIYRMREMNEAIVDLEDDIVLKKAFDVIIKEKKKI